jgi:MYXO-CTERM domain-containing protein
MKQFAHATVLLALTAVTAMAQADVAYSFPQGKGGILITPSFAAVEGNLFQVGSQNLYVTALAYENDRPNLQGITAIFNASTGQMLASATITNSDPLSNGYYWQSINPLFLHAGQQYYIGSLHTYGVDGNYIWNTMDATVPSYITDEGTYFKVSSTIDGGFWQFGGGQSQYGSGEIRHYVGNFDLTTTPAPPAMLTLVLGGLVRLRRRRRG